MTTFKMFMALINTIVALICLGVIIFAGDINIIKMALLGSAFAASNTVAILVGD